LEVIEMVKKAALALFGLIFAVALAMPKKADAQVVVRIAPRPYVYVAPGYYGPHYAYRPYVPYGVYVGPRYYGHYGYRYYARHRYGWRR
jgi:hypothetical protein